MKQELDCRQRVYMCTRLDTRKVAVAYVRRALCKGKERNHMQRLVRIIGAFVLLLATLLAAGVQAAPSQAGADQTYLVLYTGNSVAGDAITTAGGTLVY